MLLGRNDDFDIVFDAGQGGAIRIEGGECHRCILSRRVDDSNTGERVGVERKAGKIRLTLALSPRQ